MWYKHSTSIPNSSNPTKKNRTCRNEMIKNNKKIKTIIKMWKPCFVFRFRIDFCSGFQHDSDNRLSGKKNQNHNFCIFSISSRFELFSLPILDINGNLLFLLPVQQTIFYVNALICLAPLTNISPRSACDIPRHDPISMQNFLFTTVLHIKLEIWNSHNKWHQK